jgi:hypothetical protein
VDVLAAARVISATTLAHILGIAIKNAARILDQLCTAEIAIEVTHRSKRRLFGLAGLAPLRAVARPPYRADPSRRPGRPCHESIDDKDETEAAPLPPLSPIERSAFDYGALEEAMAHLDAVVRHARRALTPQVLNVHRHVSPAADGLLEGDAICPWQAPSPTVTCGTTGRDSGSRR